MKAIRRDRKYADDNDIVALDAIEREYGYMQVVTAERVYVGNNKMLVKCDKSDADLHVIANGENYYYKEEYSMYTY